MHLDDAIRLVMILANTTGYHTTAMMPCSLELLWMELPTPGQSRADAVSRVSVTKVVVDSSRVRLTRAVIQKRCL
jgi:hypothetical protein